MAKCKNCGAIIEEDSKICERCGTISPIKTKKVRTVDLTLMANDESYPELKALRKPKSRTIFLILFLLGGFLGVPYYYIKKVRQGILMLVSHLLVVATIFIIALILEYKNFALLSIISLSILFVSNISIGIYIFIKNNTFDGYGESLV